MTSPTQISVAQLNRLIGLPDAPVLVDVRTDTDFDDDPRLIPGSFRHSHTATEDLLPRLSAARAVVICQKGQKLSAGVAAILQSHGISAETLEGGQFAWRDAGAPMVRATAIPGPGARGGTRWVTRHRPKIDRMACPWLIRRFIDPAAQFLFVPPADVGGVAERFDAVPFDVEGAFWSHRGERCTFDTMLEEFGLESAPLQHLATVVRGADTDRHELAPEAAGLVAASLGLSRMYRDDTAQVNAGMLLYDAFYRWCRDATDEGHDWPPNSPRA